MNSVTVVHILFTKGLSVKIETEFICDHIIVPFGFKIKQAAFVRFGCQNCNLIVLIFIAK